MDEAEYHRRVGEQLSDFVGADPVVASTSGISDRFSTATLDATMKAIAEEAAALRWDREHAPIGSREAERAASRRTSALVQLASLTAAKARCNPRELEVRGDQFQKVVANFMNVFSEAAEQSLATEEAEKFIVTFKERLIGWEDNFDPPPSKGGSG